MLCDKILHMSIGTTDENKHQFSTNERMLRKTQGMEMYSLKDAENIARLLVSEVAPSDCGGHNLSPRAQLIVGAWATGQAYISRCLKSRWYRCLFLTFIIVG